MVPIKTFFFFTILRQKALSGKTNAVDGARRVRVRERGLAIPGPEANVEIQNNLDVCQKFPLYLSCLHT